MFLTLNILLIIFIFGLWNAYVVIWGTHFDPEERQRVNKIWHGLGLFLKVWIIALAIYTMPVHWFLILFTGFNLSWTIYDLTINAVRKKWQGLPLLHIDSMKINTTISRAITPTGFWIIKFTLLIINAILLIFYE